MKAATSTVLPCISDLILLFDSVFLPYSPVNVSLHDSLADVASSFDIEAWAKMLFFIF